MSVCAAQILDFRLKSEKQTNFGMIPLLAVVEI